MVKKTSIINSCSYHKKAGVEDSDYDPWFYETCRMVNRACDKFWTLTEDRVILNNLYYKARIDKYGY